MWAIHLEIIGASFCSSGALRAFSICPLTWNAFSYSCICLLTVFENSASFVASRIWRSVSCPMSAFLWMSLNILISVSIISSCHTWYLSPQTWFRLLWTVIIIFIFGNFMYTCWTGGRKFEWSCFWRSFFLIYQLLFFYTSGSVPFSLVICFGFASFNFSASSLSLIFSKLFL